MSRVGERVLLALQVVEPLERVLAGPVGRVRLARDEQLDGMRPVHDPPRSLGVLGEQVEALVGCEPAREPEGEHVRVEQRLDRADVVDLLAAQQPVLLVLLAHVLDELLAGGATVPPRARSFGIERTGSHEAGSAACVRHASPR